MIFIGEHFLLIMVWVLAIFISVVGYVAFQHTYPSWQELLLGHSIYSLGAMPNAFLHMISFYPPDNTAHVDIFFWLLASLYWAMIATIHYWYFQEKEPRYVGVIAILVLLSSLRWLYFAVAFMQR